jgi:tetratricopeptide (TPR) repeat protein
MSAEIRQKALELEIAKKYGEAAVLYRQLGAFDKAAYMYQKAGMEGEAVALYVEAGLFVKAAELCAKAGRGIEAGKWYEKAERFADAAGHYQRSGAWERAAEAWERAEMWLRAAEAHQRAGNAARAGEAFSKAGEKQKALRAYSSVSSSAAGAVVRRSPEELRRSARGLEKNGDIASAAALYTEAGDYMTALHAWCRAGEAADAAQIYAAHLKGEGYAILRDVPREGKLYKNYAAMFVLAGDFPMAAQVWDDFGEHIKAGELYERIKDEAAAAEAFLRGQDIMRAAMMLSLCGEHMRAAELFMQAEAPELAAGCYEKAERHFLAGKAYFQAQMFEQAIPMLQRVEEGLPEHFEASILLGRAYRAKGFTDLALERYKKILATVPLSRESLDFYYDLALLHRTKRDYEKCHQLLKQIVDLQFDFKDAAKILQELMALRSLAVSEAPAVAPVSPDALFPVVSREGGGPAPPAVIPAAKAAPSKTPPSVPPPGPRPAPADSKGSFASWISTIKKDDDK